MPSIRQIFFVAPAMFAAVAHAQGVITSAQGTKGSPASLPLQVDLTKSDANIINTQEITTNVVNECGRTLLGGNIDVGANTEDQLGNKTVTSVTKGSTVSVTIDQLNTNGAGPYTCDLDPTGNANGATGQTNLTTTEKDSNGITTLSVTMPSDLACIGASTGNVCTVRCFNTAAAGPFGGCFAVQQTDGTANKNTPQNIVTAQTLSGVLDQVAQNQKDLPAAIKSVQEASTVDQQGVLAVDDLLNIDSTASATAGVASTSAASSAKSTSAASGKTGKSGKGSAAAAKGATGATAKGATGASTATTAKGGKNANANANAKGARAFVA